MNSETTGWKDNLGHSLSSKGIYRLRFVNDRLYKTCAEWIAYLGEFNHVHPEISYKNPEDPGTDVFSGARWISLSVNIFGLIPFKAYLVLIPDPDSGMLVLKIKWTEYVDLFDSNGNFQPDKEKIYQWQEDNLTEPEIFEAEYVLQLLNMRFSKFIEKT